MFVILKSTAGDIAINPQIVAAVQAHVFKGENTCHLYLAMMDDPIAEVYGTVAEVVAKLERRD